MSLWSWVRALTEAKEKGMGHAPIACEWDHPSSKWARGWGPYKKRIVFFGAPPPSPLRLGVVPITGYKGMSLCPFLSLAQLVVRVLPISICPFGLGFELSRRRKKRAKGHALITCDWDHPSSKWARGWGPYSHKHLI